MLRNFYNPGQLLPLRYFIELVLLAAIWGASFLFMRVATPELGAVVLIELRVLLASLVLLPIWWLRGGRQNRASVQTHWRELSVVGLLNSAIPFVLFAYSTLYITGGFASVLNATVPLWGALVAWAWLQVTPGRGGVCGLLLGLIGVMVLVSDSMTLTMTGTTLGILAALFASFLYGVAANYTAQKLVKVSPLSIATFSQVAAAIALLPAAIMLYPSAHISLSAWLSVIGLGVLCTSLAYTLYFRLIANIGSTKAITVTFLVPVFGTLWGLVFLGEAITVRMIVGTLVILTGTSMVMGLVPRWPKKPG